MYNGKAYTQGQKWSDKCDKNCVCDDAKQGLYTCTDRYTLCNHALFNVFLNFIQYMKIHHKFYYLSFV